MLNHFRTNPGTPAYPNGVCSQSGRDRHKGMCLDTACSRTQWSRQCTAIRHQHAETLGSPQGVPPPWCNCTWYYLLSVLHSHTLTHPAAHCQASMHKGHPKARVPCCTVLHTEAMCLHMHAMQTDWLSRRPPCLTPASPAWSAASARTRHRVGALPAAPAPSVQSCPQSPAATQPPCACCCPFCAAGRHAVSV